MRGFFVIKKDAGAIQNSVQKSGRKPISEEKDKKLAVLDRRFSHIVSNGEQTPLDLHLFLSSEQEPAEAPVLFDISKRRFHINSAFFA